MLFAHGGGFYKGDRHAGCVGELADRLTAEGYALASASYRLATPMSAFDDADKARIRTNQRRSRRAGLSLANRLTGPAFEAARRDLGAAIGVLRQQGPALGISTQKLVMIGVSAGAIAGLSLAFPPKNMPQTPAPDAVLALCGAMVQLWRLHPKGAPCLMLNSVQDRIIAPGNTDLAARRAEAALAPLHVMRCARKGHNAPVRALLEDTDDTGTPYWAHMRTLFETSPCRAIA
ncbi:MAG: lysophospholipase [Rhodobacteraceae bacterium]|nr:lysophospholipase [Paracoccaceae bacterium]